MKRSHSKAPLAANTEQLFCLSTLENFVIIHLVLLRDPLCNYTAQQQWHQLPCKYKEPQEIQTNVATTYIVVVGNGEYVETR